jgi:hypothetical protein
MASFLPVTDAIFQRELINQKQTKRNSLATIHGIDAGRREEVSTL